MTTYDTPILHAPKPGHDNQLDLSLRTADGRSTETVLCTYLAGTPSHWVVERHGERVNLARAEWAQFAF